MKNLLLLFAGAIVFSFSSTAQNVGINTPTPSDPLDVNGNTNFRGVIKLNGNAGASNQVLMSQGDAGSPQWRSAAYSGGGRFWAMIANNTSALGRKGYSTNLGLITQSDSLDLSSANVVGTDMSVSTDGTTNNIITINKAGLYHFEGSVRYYVTCSLAVAMFPRATIKFKAKQSGATDLDFYIKEASLERIGGTETASSVNIFNYTINFDLDIHLESGATCTFIPGFDNLRYPSGAFLTGIGVSQGGYVSGHFISE